MNPELEAALNECAAYADRGYQLAQDGLADLQSSISIATGQIKDSLVVMGKSRVDSAVAMHMLNGQLSEISTNLNQLASDVEADMNRMKKGLSTFSISLFGRTMAGKSTFMEILMHGSGGSIGKGAQRTTRDVRTYEWNGLRITDVPGIAAFEGEEGEKTAFEAARAADLIIFLITDDAPQAAEADCLARIYGLGKPVLGVINAKVDVDPDEVKLSLSDIKKALNYDRLDAIRRQFLCFAEERGQDWRGIRFAYTHLKAAFLSQQPECAAHAEEFYRASRFDFVEKIIVEEVVSRGKFYRTKNFVDSLGTPLLGVMEKLLEQGAKSSEQGRLILSKRRSLQSWSDRFETDAVGRIETLLTRIRSELTGAVSAFAEENYSNPHASAAWKKEMESRKVQDRCNQLLKSLAARCNDELAEVAREIRQELTFANSVFADSSINMSKITDSRRIWNWGTRVLTAGLTVVALFSNPVGWIALGVAVAGELLSFLFPKYEKQKRDARRTLEKKTTAHIDKTLEQLKTQMLSTLRQDLIGKRLTPTCGDMSALINTLFRLSETQRDLSWKLCRKLKQTNRQLIAEALSFIGAEEAERRVRGLARIPGSAVMIVLDDGEIFPNDVRVKLSQLLKEQVWFVFRTENRRVFLSRAIGSGCPRERISIEDKLGIAHIPDMDFSANLINRVHLAQQLTELLITK